MKHLIIVLFFFHSFFVYSQENSVPLITDTNYVYRSLSAALVNPGMVHNLNLNKNKLKIFPENILKLKNLRDLDLSRNKLDSLPAEIGSLTHLERLDLSRNNLVQLPVEIGNLVELRYLGLNRNLIEELPASIGNLENLEVLELWDNELSTIPDEIKNCKKLKVLELRGILFSDQEHARLDSLLPGVKVYLSPACNCKY